MSIKVIVLEDVNEEFIITQNMLIKFFGEIKTEYEITRYSSSQEFLKNFKNNCDLLILDIMLPGDVNGIDIAKRVRTVNSLVSIMFITSTAQFALDGYSVNAVDYILKPLKYEELFIKLKKVMRHILTYTEKVITFKYRSESTRVLESKIYYLESVKHTIIAHTANGEISVRGPLSSLEKQFSKSFVRCSNSHIVNLRHIESVKGNTILINGTELTITRIQRESFFKAFYAYVGSL